MKAIFTVLVAAVLAAATWFVPQSLAQSTKLGPAVTATTLTAATSARIITANPTRQALVICNTGASNPVWIWPAASVTPTVSAYVLAPVTSNAIACYTTPSTAGIHGGVGSAWNGNSPSGSTVSVFEY